MTMTEKQNIMPLLESATNVPNKQEITDVISTHRVSNYAQCRAAQQILCSSLRLLLTQSSKTVVTWQQKLKEAYY